MTRKRNRNTGIIILAAGGSTRFGRPKQIFKYQGETLVRRAAMTALEANAGPVIFSLGADHEAVERELSDLEVTSVFNAEWRSGMSSSLISAVKYLEQEHPNIDAVVFMLCDQPLISSTMLLKLIALYEETDAAIVASEYEDTLGVPALFDRSTFDELLKLSGDEGARSVIRKHNDRVQRVSMPEAGFDIDSLTDVEALRSVS